MKRLFLVVLAVVLVGSFAFADVKAKAGQFGVQTDLIFTNAGASSPFSVGAKYMITDSLGLRASLGFLNQGSGGSSVTLYDLGVGMEFHFGGKGGVSPYAGAELSYSGAAYSSGATAPSEFGICALFGGEYFFSSNFSWAGEARLGFSSATAGGTTTTTFGTFGFATFLTWYIN
jgi:hypothetical protein